MREEQLPSAGGGVRPGSMTTAMRAVVPVAGAARLAMRIAVARAGRVEREWILERGELAIGRSEHADVVDATLPFDRIVLMRVTAESAELLVPVGARGRLQSGGAPRELEALAGVSVAMDESARGRLVIGEIAILFQRIPAPPMRLKAALPLAVQQRLFDRVDWFFTAVAAASFMLHFAGIVALTEADWPMPASLAEIDPRTVEIFYAEETPPPPETPSIDETTPSEPTEPEIARTEDPVAPTSPRSPRTSSEPTRAPTEAETLASVDTQVDLAIQQLIGGIGHDGALENVIANGAVTGSQQEMMDSVDGVAIATASQTGLRERDSAHSTQPGPIGSLMRGHVETGEHVEGTELVEHPPAHVTFVPDPDPGPDPDPTWDERQLRRLVQNRMSGIQHCYEVELTRSPELAGRVTVSMRVEEIGTLSHVHTEDDTTGSRTLGECVVRQIQSIRLTSGPEGGIVVEYPIVFAPQR